MPGSLKFSNVLDNPVLVPVSISMPGGSALFAGQAPTIGQPSSVVIPIPVGAIAYTGRIISTGGEGIHDFFEQQSARSEAVVSLSLRSQTQINGLVNSPPSIWYEYDVGVDAASFTLGAGQASVPGSYQLRHGALKGHNLGNGRALYILDFYFHGNILTGVGAITRHKEFQVADGGPGDAVGDIFYENRHDYAAANENNPGEVARINVRVYNRGGVVPAGVVGTAGYTPTGEGALATNQREIYVDRWNRYWIEWRWGIPGSSSAFDDWKTMSSYISASQAAKDAFNASSWLMLSTWHADELRDPVRTLHKVPWPMPTAEDPARVMQAFWFEHNTSSSGPDRVGDCTWSSRNFVMLRNFPSSNVETDLDEGDNGLFRKPVG